MATDDGHRWRLAPCVGLLLVSLVLADLVPGAAASGRFEISIFSLKNYRRTRMDGSCCRTGLSPTSKGRCRDECVTRCRVCLKEFINHEIKDNPSPYRGKCSFGMMTTPQMGISSFKYPKPLTVTLNIDVRWTRSFTLIIEAFDGKPTSLLGHGQEEGHGRIIDRVVYKGVLAPGPEHHRLKHVTTRGVEFDYKLQMKCDEHYYNVTCSKYCEPRNDVRGHYTCNDNGEKICKIGWSGNDCNAPICKVGCHNVHGSCEKPGECKCEAGWQGPYCTECIKYPGCMHGTCNNSPWSCKCFLNWGGRFCEKDLNYCGRHRPCKNNGICLPREPDNSSPDYRCICPLGFNGTNCEIRQPPCSVKPCQNGGTCTPYHESYYCTCIPGWTGNNCEINKDACGSNPCQNGGTCLDLEGEGEYKCICKKGYTGEACHLQTACDSSECVNGLSCADLPHNDFKCECQVGWEGKRCDKNIDDCKGKCKNGGTCTDLVDGFYCTCPAGFSGRHCEVDVDECRLNATNPCLNGGICRDRPGGFVCKCPKDYAGKRCEIDRTPCDPNPCLNGAYCYNMGSDFYCKCDENFHGKRCESRKPSCDDGSCQILDPCSLPVSMRSHDNVSLARLSPTTICGDRGRCVSLGGGKFRCECDPGFHGKFCQENYNECESNPCHNDGTCLDGANTFQCLCREGFRGKRCEYNRNECAPNPCQNGGECQDLENDFHCKCINNWRGRWCHVHNNPCQPHTCINGGKCSEDSSQPEGFLCSCPRGWRGTQCHIREITDEPCHKQLPCHHGGTCVNIGDRFTCLCKGGYEGKYCERKMNKCSPNPCFNGGTCKDLTTAYECVCQKGFAGPDCRINLDDCASSPCSFGAACVDEIGHYVCHCPEGRKGKNCEDVIGETMPKPPSCIYRRHIYDHGKTWSMDCKTCYCDKGKVNCKDEECGHKSCHTATDMNSKEYCKPGTQCVPKTVQASTCFVKPCFIKYVCRNKTEIREARDPWAGKSDPSCRPNSLSLNNRCSCIRLTFNRMLLPYGLTVEEICQAIRDLRIVQMLRGHYTIGISCDIQQYNSDIIEVAVSSASDDRKAFLDEDLPDNLRKRPMVHQLVDLIGNAVRNQESPHIALNNAIKVQVETLLVNSEDWGPPYLLPLLCVLVAIAIMSFIPIVLHHFREKRRIKMKYAPLQKANNIQEGEAVQPRHVTRNILSRARDPDAKDVRRPLKSSGGNRSIEISAPVTHPPIAVPGTSSDSGFGTSYISNQGPMKQYIYGARASGPVKDVNVAQRASGDYERSSPLVV